MCLLHVLQAAREQAEACATKIKKELDEMQEDMHNKSSKSSKALKDEVGRSCGFAAWLLLLLSCCAGLLACVVAVDCRPAMSSKRRFRRAEQGRGHIRLPNSPFISVCRCALQGHFDNMEPHQRYDWDGVLQCWTGVADLGQVELELDDPDLISDSEAPRSSSSSEGSSPGGSMQRSPTASE